MTIERQQLARRGEQYVAQHLVRQGYRLLGLNVRAGRLELDVVAERNGVLVVCEVRSRTSDRYGTPAETINRAKVARVREATRQWLRREGRSGQAVRLDAAALTFDGVRGQPRMEYYEGAL
ncbi:MAG: YraN family protein [Sandaracinaceae bacterium]|nr:YraN family protein [Sandaracinaceae bacterium]